MTFKRNTVLLFAMIILLSATMACSFNSLVGSTSQNEAINSTPVPVRTELENDAAPAFDTLEQIDPNSLEAALINLYQRINPSVVHILVYTSRGDNFPLGSGSGFVFDDNGRIVTNNHVVEGGQVYEVIFADGSRRRAEVVGRDVDSDLAVIEVDSLPESVNPVTLGDSDRLRVGQLVIAIGNPFGEQGSMSMGIISGLGRSLESQRQLENSSGHYSLPEVIQTDAPINPGNSGGPLINLQGQVVGVNSAIRTETGLNSGVGFSIPINAIRRIVPRLIQEGEYIYSYMGVQIQSLNLNLQELYDLPRFNGAYVTDITSNSPAENAGLIPASDSNGRDGDLIIAVDGQPIQDTNELIAYLVFNTDVGQTIELTVLRDGETIILPLTLGARP